VLQNSFLSFVKYQRHANAERAKKQRQPNEMNKEYQTGCDEISAQKLCAGMMSRVVQRHTGREGFYIAASKLLPRCAQACGAAKNTTNSK
jgi:hypothetical protein